MQPIELESVKAIKVGMRTNKDGAPEATFTFTTTADPLLAASIIKEASQRPLTVTIASRQLALGEGQQEDSR